MGSPNMPAKLREVMARPGIIVTPGAYDGLTARLVVSYNNNKSAHHA